MFIKNRLKRQAQRRRGNSYEKMIKTLLIQNQQIIIQQQNLMFMAFKQFNQSSSNNNAGQHQQQHQQPQPQPQQQQPQQQQQQSHNQHQIYHHSTHGTSMTVTPIDSQQQQQQLQQTYGHQTGTPVTSSLDHHHQHLQQVTPHIADSLGSYLTPASSEQDPISESNNKSEDDNLSNLLESDLLTNNLMYNPQTDIGSVTPYKNHSHQQQTPSYYSSGCESLTTPRVEQQRQPTTSNISQNVVKNLADSFKSPTKPKINVQILSGTAAKNMKNSKAKIIQRMNISEFLRHVHQDDAQRSATQ